MTRSFSAPGDSDTNKNGVSEAEIDEALAESFPASDPPAWTLGLDPHPESPAGPDDEAEAG